MTACDELADAFLQACKQRKILVATAESCTGGLIIARMTDLPGSSSMVDRGFVTYSNEAKTDLLGVSKETLDLHGAVSAEVAREMAHGALRNSRAGIAIAVTGIAGPDGGTPEKPVGLVWMAIACEGERTRVEKRIFAEQQRHEVRKQTVTAALEMALETAERQPLP